MRIDELDLNEFRGCEQRVFSFNQHFNVLIGENGSGKTTVLEALTVAISPFLSVIEGKQNLRPIRKEDVRHVSFEYSLEAKINTSIAAKGLVDEQETEWKIGRSHRDFGFLQSNDSALRQWAKKCLNQLSIDGGKDLILPLFCYMGAGRLWTESTEKAKIFPKGSRLEGYYHCLNAKGHFKRFIEWFKTMELASLQGIEKTNNANIIREIVSSCIDGWDTLIYSVADDMLMVRKEEEAGSRTLPFHYLSDGQRNMLGMVADIAYRCLLLNPYLGENCNANTPGIVLIDELDLHLHPNWQRQIVATLKRVFPKIQFITTTHSPFIVQSLENNELIDLQGKDIQDDYWRKGIEEIAQDEMGVDNATRSAHFIKMKETADRYYQLIKDNKGDKDQATINEVKTSLEALLLPYYDDPAYVSYLESFKHQLD